MNNFEAMKALVEGEKIRYLDWEIKEYVYFKNNTLINQNNNVIYINFGEGDIWELYEEPKEEIKLEKFSDRFYKHTHLTPIEVQLCVVIDSCIAKINELEENIKEMK